MRNFLRDLLQDDGYLRVAGKSSEAQTLQLGAGLSPTSLRRAAGLLKIILPIAAIGIAGVLFATLALDYGDEPSGQIDFDGNAGPDSPALIAPAIDDVPEGNTPTSEDGAASANLAAILAKIKASAKANPPVPVMQGPPPPPKVVALLDSAQKHFDEKHYDAAERLAIRSIGAADTPRGRRIIVLCHCARKDLSNAKAAMHSVATSDRRAVRRKCRKLGLDL
ncbi:MAG: hypothetical protein V3T05_13560, partial [Myxococcota bacterium]